MTNQLINETSPYLLQHAHNPVNWYAWGSEAFEKAKKENKPIFLSIGYSTCHWCHVMEYESFENKEVAELMNDAFVSIKVDREERPDIDHIYMNVCQLLTETGGWPLTIIMTPDKKPFFAGTYFSKYSKFGRVGMMDLIPQINEVWKHKHNDILNSANEITNILEKISNSQTTDVLNKAVLKTAFAQLLAGFDSNYGGFGSAPKFPSSQNLLFLLRYYKNTKNTDALPMVERTLQEMRKGGIYDQLGYGFHRYSTDSKWLLPHFEKMLYDQALLLIAYTETFQLTQNQFYVDVAKDIIKYVNRDMTSKEGGFYCAEDADSEGEEGKFYVWSEDEIKDILGSDADLFIQVFNIKKEGNYFDEATREKKSLNILHITEPFSKIQDKLDKLKSSIQKLFQLREKRIHPHKDDKILTDWNGLMIAALAKAGVVIGEKRFIDMAENSANFIFKYLFEGDKLLHSFRNKGASVNAKLDDYVYFIWGLLELYEATFNLKYLKKAISLNNVLVHDFWDKDNGAFYFTSENDEKLIVRKKEFHDGAIPSGNSVALTNLLKLGHLTGNINLFDCAEKLIISIGAEINNYPSAYVHMLSGYEYLIGKSYQIVVIGKNDENTKNVLNILRQEFLPNKTILFVNANSDISDVISLVPYIKDYKMKDGKTTIYVCENFKCNNPVTDVNQIVQLIM